MPQDHFILSLFDLKLWCSVLETRFIVDDVPALKEILGDAADDDPEFKAMYNLEQSELEALSERFSVAFECMGADIPEGEIWLTRDSGHIGEEDIPYLVHTNFELPLMLDGRKKLAHFMQFRQEAEEAFDHWVEQGALHKQVIIKPVPEALKPYTIDRGHRIDRSIYYTLKGEEWRIPAMELLWEALKSSSGGWNENYERLEGMLFGYEPWQNNWWIENANRRYGGIGGTPLCCVVDAGGLEWMKSAGYRALPPAGHDALEVRLWRWQDQEDMTAFLMENETSVALARFKVSGREQRELFPAEREASGPFFFARDRIPEINRHLVRAVDIVLTR